MTGRALGVAVGVAIALVASMGCATTSEYARFAQAGSSYAAALDHLLVAAGTVGVDATSERLLQDDAVKNQDLASYQSLTAIDADRLATIDRLRTHARLLSLYFGLLGDLAETRSPERIQSAITGVADSLNRLGTQLRQGPFVGNAIGAGDAARLVVSARVKAALKHELEERKETIRLELTTQEVLLGKLSQAIAHDLSIVRSAREQRLVINPLTDTSPITRPDDWIANRRKILTSQSTLEELARGSDAGAELRRAFEELISGRASLARLDALLTSVDGLLAVAASITR